jgi:hypothetical protein
MLLFFCRLWRLLLTSLQLIQPKVNPANTNVVKPTKMHATGEVIKISNSSIKTERTVKDDTENIAVNDFVYAYAACNSGQSAQALIEQRPVIFPKP